MENMLILTLGVTADAIDAQASAFTDFVNKHRIFFRKNDLFKFIFEFVELSLCQMAFEYGFLNRRKVFFNCFVNLADPLNSNIIC